MRKFSRFFVFLFFTGLFTAYVPATWADQQPEQQRGYFSKVGHKGLNAIANLAASPLEIPKNVVNTSNKSNVFYGIVGGVFKGAVNTAGRIGVGVFDLVTLPLPTKPIAQPVYIWDDFSVDSTYGPAFRLDRSQEAEEQPPVVQTPNPEPVVAAPEPKPEPIDASKQYNQETNHNLDGMFKKEMKK
jgi:putative exosortase-associated protein (TIGR04073 family)